MNNGFPSEVTCCGSGDGCVGEEFAVYQIVLLQQIQCLYIGVGAGYGLIAERPERSADFEIGECVAYGCEERFFTYTPTGRNRGNTAALLSLRKREYISGGLLLPSIFLSSRILHVRRNFRVPIRIVLLPKRHLRCGYPS